MRKVKTKKPNKFTTAVSKNSPAILTGLGLIGGAVTVYMAIKAAPKAEKVLANLKFDEDATKSKIFWTKTKALSPLYGPVVGMGVMSGICILGSYKISSRRTAALATACTVAESRLAEYQRQVLKNFGEEQAELIKEKVATEEVRKTELKQNPSFVLNDDDEIFFDSMSGRYFKCTTNRIEEATKKLSKRLFSEMYISLNEFYYEIGLDSIGIGEELGWNIDQGYISVEMPFISEGYKGNSCRSLLYEVQPRFDFRNLR